MWFSLRLLPRLVQGSCRKCGLVRSLHNLSLSDIRVQKYIESFDSSKETNLTLGSIVTLIQEKQKELNDLEVMCKENQELREIARADSVQMESELKELEEKFFEAVLPADEWEFTTDVIIELSAGVGGQEAMLFTQELYQMYEAYAAYRGWDWESLAYNTTELGGLRNASASVTGEGVYTSLKYEGGVHRVQRVPKTEKMGRVHTSTSTVAILPSPSEVQININPADLRIETKRAGGAGGQHVNTTESAVRITHIPTGISVDSQSQRSQIQNRVDGLKILRAKLYEKYSEEQSQKMNQSRKLQVGLGARSEKIRTYNYNQDRMTDHRIGLTSHNLSVILAGGQAFDAVVEKLVDYDKFERVLECLKS